MNEFPAIGRRAAALAMAFALAFGMALAMGCSSGNKNADDRLEPESLTADAARDRLLDALPKVTKFAFYPEVSPSYLQMTRAAWEPMIVYENAQENRDGIATTMMSDTVAAFYQTSFNTIRVAEDEADPWPSNGDIPAPAPASPITRPTVMVGTLVFFGDAQTVLMVPVYRHRGGAEWFVVFEGHMGDLAFYRIGKTGRAILSVAMRPFRLSR